MRNNLNVVAEKALASVGSMEGRLCRLCLVCGKPPGDGQFPFPSIHLNNMVVIGQAKLLQCVTVLVPDLKATRFSLPDKPVAIR